MNREIREILQENSATYKKSDLKKYDDPPRL